MIDNIPNHVLLTIKWLESVDTDRHIIPNYCIETMSWCDDISKFNRDPRFAVMAAKLEELYIDLTNSNVVKLK